MRQNLCKTEILTLATASNGLRTTAILLFLLFPTNNEGIKSSLDNASYFSPFNSVSFTVNFTPISSHCRMQPRCEEEKAQVIRL